MICCLLTPSKINYISRCGPSSKPPYGATILQRLKCKGVYDSIGLWAITSSLINIINFRDLTLLFFHPTAKETGLITQAKCQDSGALHDLKIYTIFYTWPVHPVAMFQVAWNILSIPTEGCVIQKNVTFNFVIDKVMCQFFVARI